MAFVEIAFKNQTGEIQPTTQFNKAMQIDKKYFLFCHRSLFIDMFRVSVLRRSTRCDPRIQMI